MNMPVYIFTFGINQKYKGNFQPIVANSFQEAEKLMFKHYGKDWAFGYTEKSFNASRHQGFFVDLKPLPIIQKEAV